MTNPTSRAFWIERPGKGSLREESLPALGEGDVRVRTLYTAVSRGTESLIFQGKVPQSQWQAMRAPHQGGFFPAPLKYGYINVGVVEDGALPAGTPVFCLFPHQDRYVVPAESVTPLPASLPPERAVLAANMETAINGLWDAAPLVGDRIAVIGAGVVGCLVAFLASRLPGAQIELIDVDPAKAAIAEALGITFALTRDASREADIIIHASGNPMGLQTALTLAGYEATILEMSWYGSTLVPLPLGEEFHSKRLILKSSQVGGVSPARRARRGYGDRMALALSLLQDARLDALITGESPFEELPELMATLSTTPSGTLCHRIRY
ncbi:MAG: zinc-binding alcohol dehydrogenase [Alphaproteobacteria bacterium]|nr:zinc-binding alcohol dehydrogenase [Alphaproteobacteria bacterium]MBU0799008.1 zinc-binding alcohol dehydrogenase [Alphaproteobacteria bacterium]MBU0889238.1 zinc-binding alcohol dehydrogenase [Alphaproteobacteria bacterium]MBU1815054.1 zinc-binding alcohol dehydrogenase [Alphaproteobacteria bacterium]MBU2090276.1 zinc-binding alcohol dehydrogenase [Alphaproteobacteria bacterium]